MFLLVTMEMKLPTENVIYFMIVPIVCNMFDCHIVECRFGWNGMFAWLLWQCSRVSPSPIFFSRPLSDFY